MGFVPRPAQLTLRGALKGNIGLLGPIKAYKGLIRPIFRITLGAILGLLGLILALF